MAKPKLRFKEFNDEWNKIDLRDAFEFHNTNSLTRNDLSDIGIIRNIHYGDIHQKFNNILDVNTADLPYIKANINLKNISIDNYCENGDLIFADASEDYDGIGKAIELINIGNNKILSGLHTILARNINNTMYTGFKGYLFNAPIVHNQIRVLATGFKVFGISKNTIRKLKVNIPSMNEQEKIANFLILLDKKIALQNKKVETLKIYKKGLLYKIFKYKIPNFTINDALIVGKAGGTPKSTNIEYYNGTIPFLSITDMTSQGKYIQKTEKYISEKGLKNSSAWLLPINTLILSMYASYGLVSINKIELATSQAMFSMIFNKNINTEYIFYYLEYLKEKKFYNQLVSTGTQSNLNANKVKNIQIYIPKENEQNKISSLLNMIDKKNQIQENKLKEMKYIKKGLLQKMFV